MSRRKTIARIGGACLAVVLAFGATAQTSNDIDDTTTTTTTASSPAKKELVQKILLLQQPEIESVARSIVERPAAQMMQEAGLAMQRQVPPEKREAMGKAIEAEVKKYVDESYPLVRERAIRLAPSTLGAALEEKFNEDELKQLLGWLESPVNKKFQQLAPARNAFVQKVLCRIDRRGRSQGQRARRPDPRHPRRAAGEPGCCCIRPADPARRARRPGERPVGTARSAWHRPRPAASRRSPSCASRSTRSTPSCSR